MTDTPMKRCTKCGEEKPATTEYFYAQKRRNGKYGLFAECKPCQKARIQTYQRANPDKVSVIHKRYYQTHKYERVSYQQQYRAKQGEGVNLLQKLNGERS